MTAKRDWLRLDVGARFVPVAQVLGEYRTLDGCDFIIIRPEPSHIVVPSWLVADRRGVTFEVIQGGKHG